jgi:hypothetical protein
MGNCHVLPTATVTCVTAKLILAVTPRTVAVLPRTATYCHEPKVALTRDTATYCHLLPQPP